jgi:hypothetical protein
MALPQQVQNQIAAAEQLELQLSQPAETQAPEAPTPAPETPAAPDPAAPTPAPTPAPAPTHDDAAAEARYKVLQGKYNAEIPALHQQTRELNAQVARLTAALQQQQESKPAPAPTELPGATPKDIDDFGGDMVGMVQRIAHSSISTLAVRIDNEFAKLRSELSHLTGRAQLTASQQFDKDLLAAVPDWAEVDAEPEWLTWLGEADPFTGIARQSLLTDAHQNLDAKRVAAIFNAYKATKPAAPAAPETPAAPSVDRSALERQVAPNRASAQATPQQATVSVWTDAAIEAFYRDVKLGKFRGRETEQATIEADLNAAIAEGRYRPR